MKRSATACSDRFKDTFPELRCCDRVDDIGQDQFNDPCADIVSRACAEHCCACHSVAAADAGKRAERALVAVALALFAQALINGAEADLRIVRVCW